MFNFSLEIFIKFGKNSLFCTSSSKTRPPISQLNESNLNNVFPVFCIKTITMFFMSLSDIIIL